MFKQFSGFWMWSNELIVVYCQINVMIVVILEINGEILHSLEILKLKKKNQLFYNLLRIFVCDAVI